MEKRRDSQWTWFNRARWALGTVDGSQMDATV
jgi:hypothetical protein